MPPATELDVPIPLTRRMLAERLEDHYGPGRSLCLYRGAKPIDRAECWSPTSVAGTHTRPTDASVIDPVLGRIAFSERDPSEEDDPRDCARLSVGAIGGGSYARPLAPPRAPVYRVGVQVSGDHGTINGALKAWRKAQARRRARRGDRDRRRRASTASISTSSSRAGEHWRFAPHRDAGPC